MFGSLSGLFGEAVLDGFGVSLIEAPSKSLFARSRASFVARSANLLS